MVSREWCQALPKVELHVHFEGSVRPETVLALAKRHDMPLPADTVEGLREWYRYRDFRHFVEIYVAVTQRIKTADDLILVGEEFVDGQVAQNVVHSEVTYTAATVEEHNRIAWPDQLAALHAIQEYGRQRGTSVQFILDIVRGHHDLARAHTVVDWAAEGHEQGVVCALGMAGEEWRGTLPYQEAVSRAASLGLPFVPHAGETCGPQVIWECLTLDPTLKRIGHGVRCVEDASLVGKLRENGVVLEVCPTSNVALGVVPDLASHQLPWLRQEGLRVTLNSDDPPMFNTTLTDELFRCAEQFGLTESDLAQMQRTAMEASYAPLEVRQKALV